MPNDPRPNYRRKQYNSDTRCGNCCYAGEQSSSGLALKCALHEWGWNDRNAVCDDYAAFTPGDKIALMAMAVIAVLSIAIFLLIINVK